MFLTTTRAALLMSLAIGLTACMPTTTTAPVTQVVTLPSNVPVANELYVASKDNGIDIPAIPVEKVPEQFRRQEVDFPSTEAPGTVIIYPGTKHLYFITGNNKAIRYGIAVGAAGFQWSGEALVTNRRHWPTWTPPAEMIERKPTLAKWAKGQPGGPTNPLGSRALYLTTKGIDYGYRIHGTPEWWTIGKNASSGCIRMINQDVIDLYERVQPNAKVIVMTASGEQPKGLTLPPPAPKKKKVAPAAEVTPVAVTPLDATAPQLAVPGSMNSTPLGVPPALQTPALDSPPVNTPATTAPAVNVPTATAPATAPVAPLTPASPAPFPTPSVSQFPATSSPAASAPLPLPAPMAATPSTPAAPSTCAVALVNGSCPQG